MHALMKENGLAEQSDSRSKGEGDYSLIGPFFEGMKIYPAVVRTFFQNLLFFATCIRIR